MKFCKDCKYCMVINNRINYARCARTDMQYDPVTGEEKYRYCWSARSLGESCGPEGHLFEVDDLVAAWHETRSA